MNATNDFSLIRFTKLWKYYFVFFLYTTITFLIEEKNLKSVTEMAEYALEMNFFRRETLINNNLNQVADQQFSLQQWFAVGVQSCRLTKSGFVICY